MGIIIKELSETISLGNKLGALLKKGDILLLEGDLGAGKTTLTQGIAKGMGIKGYVKSPTFTYVIEYLGSVNLYHFDLYRLQEPEEVFDLGFDDFLDKGVIVMEWGALVEDLLMEEGIKFIKISIKNIDENTREFTILENPRGMEIKKELE